MLCNLWLRAHRIFSTDRTVPRKTNPNHRAKTRCKANESESATTASPPSPHWAQRVAHASRPANQRRFPPTPLSCPTADATSVSNCQYDVCKDKTRRTSKKHNVYYISSPSDVGEKFEGSNPHHSWFRSCFESCLGLAWPSSPWSWSLGLLDSWCCDAKGGVESLGVLPSATRPRVSDNDILDPLPWMPCLRFSIATRCRGFYYRF